jgi:hypothetical protein
MNVEELIELLKPLPPTATVLVLIANNWSYDGLLETLEDAREAQPLRADYERGEVFIKLLER